MKEPYKEPDEICLMHVHNVKGFMQWLHVKYNFKENFIFIQYMIYAALHKKIPLNANGILDHFYLCYFPSIFFWLIKKSLVKTL